MHQTIAIVLKTLLYHYLHEHHKLSWLCGGQTYHNNELNEINNLYSTEIKSGSPCIIHIMPLTYPVIVKW